MAEQARARELVSAKNAMKVADVMMRAREPDSPIGRGAALLRHTSFYLLGRIATGVVGLIALAAFTRILSPRDYGRYAVIVAIVSLIVAVGFQWLRQGLVRFGTHAPDERSELLATLGLMFAALVGATVVAAVLVNLVGRVFHFHLSDAELGVICVVTFAQAWFELAADAARIEFKPWRYSAATLLRAFLCLLFGVAAAKLMHNVVAVVLGIGAGYVVASTVVVPRWFIGMLRPSMARWADARRIATYGLPLAVTLGMAFVLDSADRLMLAGMRGYAEAGVYASAYNLAQFSIGTLLAGIGLGSLPLAVGSFADGGADEVRALLNRNLLLGLVIGVPAVVGLSMIAPELDRLFLGNDVPGQSDLVTILVAFATGLAGIRSYCIDVVFMLHRRTWLQATVTGVSAALNILMNLFFIPRWGAIGAAAATLIAFAVAMVGSWVLAQRFVKLSCSLRDCARIGLGTALLAVAVWFVLPSDQDWVRLSLAVIVGATAYGMVVLATDLGASRARLVEAVRAWRRGVISP